MVARIFTPVPPQRRELVGDVESMESPRMDFRCDPCSRKLHGAVWHRRVSVEWIAMHELWHRNGGLDRFMQEYVEPECDCSEPDEMCGRDDCANA